MSELKGVEGELRRVVSKVEAVVGGSDDDADPLDDFREKLNAFKAFRDNDREAADKILESLGGQGQVEKDMLLQLAAWRPLNRPELFEAGHQVAMRALEVLYRNGHRKAPLKLWIFTPVGQYFVQFVTRFVVRDHVKRVVTSIENLYLRRWTSTPKDAPEAAMLRKAAFQVQKVGDQYERKGLGLPTFLAGGAFASSLTGLLSNIGTEGTKNRWILGILAVVLYLLLTAMAYAVIKGSAVARRRIKMALDKPLENLWYVVGAAGNPPKDRSSLLAMWSLVVMGIAAVLVPIAASIIIVTYA